MLAFKLNIFSLTSLPEILDNPLMHHHHPIDRIVRKGNALELFDDLLKNYRPGLVDRVCIQDESFEPRT